MPLDDGEIPDHRLHCYCGSCEQWHHPEDGSTVVKKAGPFSALIGGYRNAVGDKDPRARWVCFGCQEKPPRRGFQTFTSIVILIMIIGLIWVLWDVLDVGAMFGGR